MPSSKPPPSLDEHHVFSVPPAAPPPLPTTHERRGGKRAAYLTLVVILRDDKLIEGRTEDLSEGGLQIVTHEPLAHGEMVVVRFAPPHTASPESFRVVVRWARTDGKHHAAGVSFLAVTVGARSRIAAYVAIG